MKQVAKQLQKLTVKEYSHLGSACKKAIESRRTSWCVATLIEQKVDADKNSVIKGKKINKYVKIFLGTHVKKQCKQHLMTIK